jgi:hypothetical protein
MNDKKTQKLLLILFFANMALLGAYGYLSFSVKEKNKQTTLLYFATRQAESSTEEIRKFERTMKETEIERGKLSSYFVPETNPIAFIEQMEKIAKSTGVDLSIRSVFGDTKNDESVSLDFFATGNFSNLYRLVALVESVPYKVGIKKAILQKSVIDQETGQMLWSGDFTITLESFKVNSENLAKADKNITIPR